ncbi:AIR synthase-related protein [Methanolapillus ohkumae]|uniref:Selenide, water dikinase n=1 Tax=Methanolapillus ohkumae TaxID=3028298 RepID=A0AA96V5F8_9EURY|nr:Selenide, water dikinase [Methanosarcinaceae archaeon Am2]
MDLEGYAKQLILKNKADAESELKKRILEIKDISENDAKKIAAAVLEETNFTLNFKEDILTFQKADVSVGNFGVGSRGIGDFYVHGKIGEVIGKTEAVLDASNLDDSGVVSFPLSSPLSNPLSNPFLVLTVDGMHSRLSAFPFLAGFHVARAALRDIYVMGAKPLAMLSDIHVADDGDVAMIFDHLAGISAVSELTKIPLITGSTLRIGGDMVIGGRMTGCVGAAAVLISGEKNLTARKKAAPGDLILMTKGAGGGTIVTTAIYSGYENAATVIDKTLNTDFLSVCQSLLDRGLNAQIHVMTDVTNGGIRGDAHEISKEAGVRLIFDDAALQKCVDAVVLEMLDSLCIDFRGVSIDSLLVICPPEIVDAVICAANDAGSEMFVVGRVEKADAQKPDDRPGMHASMQPGAFLIKDGQETDFLPLFREAPYTPLKKAIGENTPPDFEEMRQKVDEAAEAAVLKKARVVRKILEKEKKKKRNEF